MAEMTLEEYMKYLETHRQVANNYHATQAEIKKLEFRLDGLRKIAKTQGAEIDVALKPIIGHCVWVRFHMSGGYLDPDEVRICYSMYDLKDYCIGELGMYDGAFQMLLDKHEMPINSTTSATYTFSPAHSLWSVSLELHDKDEVPEEHQEE